MSHSRTAKQRQKKNAEEDPPCLDMVKLEKRSRNSTRHGPQDSQRKHVNHARKFSIRDGRRAENTKTVDASRRQRQHFESHPHGHWCVPEEAQTGTHVKRNFQRHPQESLKRKHSRGQGQTQINGKARPPREHRTEFREGKHQHKAQRHSVWQWL